MKLQRNLSKVGQRLVEAKLSDGITIDLIPVRVKANPLSPRQAVNPPPGISPGVRIVLVTQTDAESEQPQEIVKKERRLGVVDMKIINQALTDDKRIRLVPIESGVNILAVTMHSIRRQAGHRV